MPVTTGTECRVTDWLARGSSKTPKLSDERLQGLKIPGSGVRFPPRPPVHIALKAAPRLGFSPTGAFFCPKRGLTGHDRGSTRVAREVNGPTRINREPNTLARIVAGGYPRRMSQVTAHKDAERADNVGFWVGVGAMTLKIGRASCRERVCQYV